MAGPIGRRILARAYPAALLVLALVPFSRAVPAAALPPPTLASTPEADLTDPFLIAKAAELGGDPAAIFAFVRDDIAFEVYTGSLRGARGTLWSGAGNSADKASLLVGLLRVSGVPARWVRGTLPAPQAKLLIASMFPPLRQVTGCVSPAVVEADPVNDPSLVAEASDHFWAQFDDGGGFRDADPSFAGAELDDSFTTVNGTFDVLPEAVRHRVRLRLLRELTNPFAGLLTGGAAAQDVAVVLDTDGAAAELVGRPLTFGHFVSTASSNALFAVTQHTYSPYVIVGGGSVDPTDDGVVRGTDYQETLTSFFGGSEILTGVFLEVDLVAPGGDERTFRRAILDRIGVAGRRNGGVAVDIQGDDAAFSPADLTTLEILGGRYDGAIDERWNPELQTLRDAATEFETRLQATPPAQRHLLGRESADLIRNVSIAMARTRLAQFLVVSDEFAPRNARNLAVKAFHASPRLTLYSSRSRVTDSDELVFEVGFDLLENSIRALPWPGQNPAAAIAFQIARGTQDTAFEDAVLSTPDAAGTETEVRLNAAAILDQANTNGIPLAVLTADKRARLAELDLPAQAVILIGDALDAGRLVLVPEQALTIDGEQRVGWYEIDPATGATIGVLDDGSHGVLETIATSLAAYLPVGAAQFITGYLAGWGVSAVAIQVRNFFLKAMVKPFLPFSAAKNAAVAKTITLLLGAKALVQSQMLQLPGFVLGFTAAITPQLYALTQDPPLDDLLLVPAPQEAFEALGGPGVDLGIEPEPLLFLSFAGAAVPTLFRLGIHNGGATEQLYNLSFDALPPGFTAQTSVGSVPVAPGETAEVGVCLRPSGPLGAPGSNAAFTVRVTPQSNPGAAVTEVEPFLLPAIHGVLVEAEPTELSTAPGVPVGATITVRSAGNVAESVNFALDLPAGLGASGVPGNVPLAKGASTMFAATFTPSAGTPLNTTLTAVLNASFGGIEPTRLEIPVRIGTPGADAIHAAAVAARELGENDLAQRLEDLGVALNRLVADPTNAALRGQALASLSSILSLLGNIQSLAGFIPELEDARDALAAAANGAQVLAAITTLGVALDPFADQAEDLAAHAVELLLQPASQAAQPGMPAVFDLLLHNVGTATTTYQLATGLVPAGVTPMLSQPSVVLAPDAFSTGITLTLTQSAATELVAGSFRVDVSPGGFPGIVTSVHGSLLGRPSFVSVVAVVPVPAFADAGEAVDVSARILNAVNREQPALVSYRVLDPSAQQVFASMPVQTTLTVATSLVTLDLGELDTTGFDPGVHTIEVKVTDLAAVPIPGGLGEAALLIGSPVTAALSVSPEVVAPGDVTVTTTLSIKSQPQPGAPLAVIGELDIATPVFDVAIRGDIAYVCGSNGVHVVDVSDRTQPVLVTTKTAFPHTVCDVTGNRLIAFDRGPASGQPVQLNSSVTNFDLAGSGTPLNPFRTQTIFYNYEFTHEGVIDGGRLYTTTNLVRFSGNDIFAQHGDVISFDISNTGNMQLLDVLFNTNGTMSQPPLFASGSNFNMFGVVQPDATTLLVGSTTATGGDTQTGDGILRIVDVSNPLALAEHSTFTVPGTTQVQGIVLEGDLALVLASEGGWLDPFVTASDIGPTGNIVLATLDVSDPRNPLLLDTHTVVRAARGMGGPVALGFGQFLFWSLGGLADTPQLFRVNAGDPLAIAVSTPVNLTDPPRRGDVDASYLYLADGHGLTIFSFHSAPTPITAEVRIPNDGSVEVVPGSFSIAPDSVVPSVGFDTLTWTLQNGATLTWNALLDDMLPGERREVALGATVDFVYSATPGSIELPEIAVAAEQILAIDPPARTVAPGVTTSYDLTVRNPTASAKNYALAVQALPAAWVDLPSAVMVPAHSESVLPLEVTPDGFAVPGDYEFSVLATSGAIAGSVSATLEVAGAAVFPPPMPTAAGVVVELTPSQATGGQGTAAFFVARVTNTGSATASFDLGGMFPAGFVATFEEDQVGLQPGLDQFRDVTLALTPPVGTAGGLYPFQVTAAGALDPSVNDQAGGSILVSTLGVALELEPDPPGSITDFDLTVTNTGMATASFDLDLAGPLAADAMLGAATVMLGASQSTVVAVTLGTPDGILAGLHPLIAVATAQANPAVQATATTLVDIPETTALEAEIAPAEVMTDPGNVERLVFTIRNAGNVEIELRAFLSDLEGPIDADLLGLDGMPAAMVEGFRLPPFGETGLDIDATLLTAGEGEVTARVERVDDTDVAAIATALLGDNLCGAGSAGGYDIDLTGTVQPLTDALLILRHLFGFGGSPLVTGAIGTGATRSDAAAITAYLQCIRMALLDVDGDGAAAPLTDGLLLLRYMFGFRGAVLVANAVGVDCERCNGEAIEGFIEEHLAP